LPKHWHYADMGTRAIPKPLSQLMESHLPGLIGDQGHGPAQLLRRGDVAEKLRDAPSGSDIVGDDLTVDEGIVVEGVADEDDLDPAVMGFLERSNQGLGIVR